MDLLKSIKRKFFSKDENTEDTNKYHADHSENNDPATEERKNVSQKLKLESIPRHSIKALMASEFQQEIQGIENKPIEYLTNRYADTLWNLINVIKLSDEDIEKLILPVICNLYDCFHLLPASEYHHHAHVGGLIQHTLEVSAYCAAIASDAQFPKADSSRQQYDEKLKWVTAAAVMGLIHDCGKIYDVECSGDDETCIWNPHQCGLRTWLRTAGLTRYYVKWLPDRKHGSHELRSIRVAYLHILPTAFEQYFGFWTDSLLMNAVEEAIVFKRGPLAEILKTAEMRSIENDTASRPHTFSSVNTIPVPPVRSAVAAINELLRTGNWSVNNSSMGPLWFNESGLFLVLSPTVLSDIRETAKVFGNVNIPASSDGLIEIFSGSAMLKTADGQTGTSSLWQIKFDNEAEPLGPCICFTNASIFFQDRPLPEAASFAFTPYVKDSKPQTGSSHGLLAPKSSFLGDKNKATAGKPEEGHSVQQIEETPETIRADQSKSDETDAAALSANNRSEDSGCPASEPASDAEESATKTESDSDKSPCATPAGTACLSDSELRFVSEKPMPAQEAKIFLERLIATLITHMMQGGFLAQNRRAGKDGLITCSAAEVINVLKNRKLDELSLKTLIKVRRASPRLCFDEHEGVFLVNQCS